MPILEIKNFAQGIDTQSDSEDSGKFVEFKNLDIDKRGKAVKRSGVGDPQTNDSYAITRLYKWVNYDDNDTTEWVASGYDPSNDYILRLNATNFGTTVSATSSALTDGSAQIIPINERIRIADGRDKKAQLMQYIEREFFFGNYQPTDGVDISNAELAYPSTWIYQDVTEISVGSNGIGHYYYKFVPVFDGNQEAVFGDVSRYHNLTTVDRTLKTGVKVDTANFNKRITAIKVYRSYNELSIEPSYYHIKTIPVNTDSSHDDLQVKSPLIGTIIYDPDQSLTLASVGDWLWIAGTKYYQISSISTGGEYAIVDSQHQTTFNGIDEDIWGGAWRIYGDSSGPVTTNLIVSGSNGYAGREVLFNSAFNYKDDELKYWVADIADGYAQLINKNNTKVIHIVSDAGTYGSKSVNISNGYYYSTSGTTVTLHFYDYGLLDGSPHPLGGKDKITVNYGCGDYLNGRLFVGNVKLDPDGEAEVHRDWIIYSEFLQPDVLPIANYIQIKDSQGGDVKQVKAYNNDLVVFGERGIFRLNVPLLDPSGWSLTEAEKNVGLVAPDSVVEVEHLLFFAAKDNVYVITPNFQVYPIANDIKDDYQGTSNLEDSFFKYDVKNQRMLCIFGKKVSTIYAFDLRPFLTNGATVWTKIDLGTNSADILAIDEDLKIFIAENVNNVNSIAVNAAGSGYTTHTVVSISGGGGSGATATATVGFGVASATITSTGSGYTSAPTVVFSSGDGVGATATAAVGGGKVLSVTITDSGSGYTSSPIISFFINGGGGSGAAATANLASTGTIKTVAVDSGGSGYTSAPTVGFSVGTGATATAAVTGATDFLNLTEPSSTTESIGTEMKTGHIKISDMYNNGRIKKLNISYDTLDDITARLYIDKSTTASSFYNQNTSGQNYIDFPAVGFVSSITRTAPGSGYTSIPSVTISGGGGSGAAGTAVVNAGEVLSITITSAGQGYTSSPNVSINGGGGFGATATATLSSHINNKSIRIGKKAKFVQLELSTSASVNSVNIDKIEFDFE